MNDPHPPIVIFDGVCALCNRFVRFCVARDRSRALRFAARESDAGRAILARFGVAPEGDTVVLIEGGKALTHSNAALRISAHLRPPWAWLRVLRLIPRAGRDPLYRLIARHRYRIFGRLDACPVPSPELRRRIIESAEDLPESLAG